LLLRLHRERDDDEAVVNAQPERTAKRNKGWQSRSPPPR
jgi:hypothetical protein